MMGIVLNLIMPEGMYRVQIPDARGGERNPRCVPSPSYDCAESIAADA